MKNRIAIGADGSGTTFAAIVEACRAGRIPAELVLLFSNKETCGAAEKARAWNIPVVVLQGTVVQREIQLSNVLEQDFAPLDLVCLAGYLRLIPKSVLGQFPRKILNSHPALDLMRFGGKGMFGTHVTKAELAAGLQESGSTIHVVSEEYDRGDIILQSHTLVPVLPDDTPETFLARKLPQERALYIEAIRMLLEHTDA